MNHKAILVTGGAGYIGSLLVPELLRKNYAVRVLDNLMHDQAPFLAEFIDDKLEFIKGDVRDAEEVKRAVKGVDVIIHLAAIVGAPACKKNPKLAEEINYFGTVNVNNARDVSQKMLYASTGSVYGKVNDVCVENHPATPLSLYGQTKLRAEQEVMKKGNAISYRFATAFGLAPRLRLDLMPNDFVFSALRNKYLVVYDKEFNRTFIHVKDIVKSYIFGIENFDRMKNEVYNVGSEELNKTKEEIANLIKNKIDFEIYYANTGISDPDQRDYAVSYQKIRDAGFHVDINFDKGFDELIKGLQFIKIRHPFSNT